MMTERLEILGRLTILGEKADRFAVEFRGDVVALTIPNVRAALALRRKMSRPRRRAWLLRSQELLTRAGLELQVWIGGRQVARLGAVTRSGRLAAWLGLDPLEFTFRSAPKPIPIPIQSGRPPKESR